MSGVGGKQWPCSVRVVLGLRLVGDPKHEASLTFTWLSLGLTISSWLCAPFIFNPYMFKMASFRKDLRAWWGFFFAQDGGMRWVEW